MYGSPILSQPFPHKDTYQSQGFLTEPKKKILESLELAHMIKTNEQFKDNKIIDLRISNHIIASNE